MSVPRVAALAILGAVALAPAAQAEKVLRVTLQLPITNILGQNLVAFKEAVEKASDGELKIEIFPSAQLYKDKEVPQAVASGAIEMGVASLTRFAGTLPAVDLFYVPFLFDDLDAVAKATTPESPIRQLLDEQILATGARPLWWQAFGLAIMLSRDSALDDPAKIKDKKVRVFGKILGDFVTAAGGAPTLLSGSEQFLAYQRGTVDAGMTGVTAVKSRKLFEVMDHMTLTNHADVEFIVLINEAAWQGLSEQERDILRRAARQVESDLRAQYAKVHNDTIEWVKANTEMAVHDLTPGQRAVWREATRSVVDLYVDRAGPIGAKLVAEAKKLQ
jgi:C4-dicarboxylate-binding protein DctP